MLSSASWPQAGRLISVTTWSTSVSTTGPPMPTTLLRLATDSIRASAVKPSTGGSSDSQLEHDQPGRVPGRHQLAAEPDHRLGPGQQARRRGR